MSMKILLLIQNSPNKVKCRRTSVFIPNIFGGSEGFQLREIWLFLLSLSLETVFPALKLTQNWHIRTNIFFLGNW